MSDRPDRATAAPAEQLSLLGDDVDGTPPDQPARQRIASDLESTLFVEAGAGSGKTTALVDRIVSLVHSGVELESIAAITFTEKAAAELRQRVRDRLEAEFLDTHDPGLRTALEQLDAAPLSTLHAFAQRILFEHPIEAGLPPGVEVLDELSSQVDFEERWTAHLPTLLRDERMAGPLLMADVIGIGPAELRSLAQQFEDNWDLLAERFPTIETADFDPDPTPVVAALRRVATAAGEALDATDALAMALEAAGRYADEIEACASRIAAEPVDALVELLELLHAEAPAFGTKNGDPYKQLGNKRAWPDPDRCGELKLELWKAGQTRNEFRQRVGNRVLHRLAAHVGQFVLDAVDERRREGRLRFHDLLVMARETLRDPGVGARVRAALHERYQRLLIDEYQDTDPIQVDLAVLIAATHDPTSAHWSDVCCEPGRLFFVGDPKQSIYRFRRADIATYLRSQSVFGGDSGQVQLTTNFRSTRPVIEWVNRVFADIIQPEPASQPVYTPLDPVRERTSNGPGVMVLGHDVHDPPPPAPELRRREAADVVHTIRAAVRDRWLVGDGERDGSAKERPARLGDITILLPARTSLPALEQALEDAGIPYRAETASLVYATPEVRDLLMIARAVDDPTDELAVVAALRTSAFACGDDDLYRYRQVTGATWDHQRLRDDIDHSGPVVDGLRYLADLHRERSWLAPAQVLDRITRDRRLLQLGVCQLRHREVWRRIRFVTDQARAWTDATGGDLRDYLAWVRLQASESSRVAETVLPETDSDAVRIMTVHASKGLEFPITIVSGLTTQRQKPRSRVDVLWPSEGAIGLRVGSTQFTPEYEAFKPVDEQMDEHERLRLLYVACTRARDHLVVSMHRADDARNRGSLAWVLARAGAGNGVATVQPGPLSEPSEPDPVQRPPLPPYDEWAERRRGAVTTATRSRTVAATTLAQLAAEQREDPGLQKAGRDLDLPPWQKGRYGTAIGRAVHGVLQTVDLGTSEGLAELAAAQAAAEGVLGRERVIAALAGAALDSSTVREAAALPHWREIFVAAPVGDRLVEGYVDLLYRRDDGFVVVDHKTDAWRDDEDLDDKVDRYRIQTAAYAVAVEASTGVAVTEAILLFLAEDGATARVIPDLGGAKREVLSIVPTAVAGGEASSAD